MRPPLRSFWAGTAQSRLRWRAVRGRHASSTSPSVAPQRCKNLSPIPIPGEISVLMYDVHSRRHQRFAPVGREVAGAKRLLQSPPGVDGLIVPAAQVAEALSSLVLFRGHRSMERTSPPAVGLEASVPTTCDFRPLGSTVSCAGAGSKAGSSLASNGRQSIPCSAGPSPTPWPGWIRSGPAPRSQ